jgi:hypothetical protein
MPGRTYFVYKRAFVFRLLISSSARTEIRLFRISQSSQRYDLCVSEETMKLLVEFTI